MNNVVNILKKARKLIEKPENWIKDDFARNKEGHYNHQLDPGAVSFCSLGALKRAAWEIRDKTGSLSVAMRQLEQQIKSTYVINNDDRWHHGGHIIPWNDHPGRKHEEVLEVFDKAIRVSGSLKNRILGWIFDEAR